MKIKPSHIATIDDLQNYYWMKSELIAFCKERGLPTQGAKLALVERINIFLSTGKRVPIHVASKKSARDSLSAINENTVVIGYHNDAETRKFFVRYLGETFKFNSYLRQFTNSENIQPGMTYGDLINGWVLAESNKSKHDAIAPQFEYNQFIRDYFANEPDATLAKAISAWKKLSTKRGPRQYRERRKMGKS